MGGFLSGIFWGGIVGAVALLVSSLTLDRQQLSFPKPEAAEVKVPGGSQFDQARPETDTVLPTAESKPEADAVAAVEAPEDAVDDPPALDTAALELPEPEVDAPAGLGEAPEVPTDDVPEVATDDAPASDPLGETLASPEAPGQAPETAVTDPVAPETEDEGTASDVVTTEEAPEPQESETQIAALPEATPEEDQPETMSAPAVTSVDDAPQAPSQPEIAEDSSLPSSGGADAGVDESPEAPRLPQISQEPSLPDGSDTPTISEAPEAPVNPATDGSTGAASITVDGGPSALVPVDDLEDQADGVETSRLPQAGTSTLPTVRRIGAGSDSDTEDAVVEDAEDGDGDTGMATGPALSIYSAAFDNPEGRPLMSVVLVQADDAPLSQEVLEGLPEHVSFAIDAGGPAAANIARTYRENGREVVMIPSLPQGAQPQDVEQALRVNFETIPEAVAVMDITGSSFQSDRSAVQQVVDVASASGHGIITFPRGLNTAHQQAQKAGVPTGLIFRNLDGSGETQEQIRRTMDRAAFRARQNDGVILVGTTDTATLAALVEWALGNRATSVTIAPVSAALAADR